MKIFTTYSTRSLGPRGWPMVAYLFLSYHIPLWEGLRVIMYAPMRRGVSPWALGGVRVHLLRFVNRGWVALGVQNFLVSMNHLYINYHRLTLRSVFSIDLHRNILSSKPLLKG